MRLCEETEKQYLLALEADPNHAAAHYNYGNILIAMGRKEEAEKQYLLTLEADPNNAVIHNSYGVHSKRWDVRKKLKNIICLH